jgi:acyl-CoA synthetase (NDP forming)
MLSVNSIFNARNIAVVGASATAGKTGNTVLKNLIDGGYEGDIYPVNPRGGQLMGNTCFTSLEQVPTDIDLIVVIVPAAQVPEVMEQAGRKNVKGAIIISGGFRETGNEELERTVLNIAACNHIRILGPNCQGLNYTPNKMCASWPLITARGSIAVISQSGTVGAAIEMWAAEDHLGISAFVALGNKSDINEQDLIRYFADDPNTKTIALNIEGVKDGKGFIDCIRYCVSKKPVVVLKPGRTAKGQTAAQSHTKSIGGMDQIFEAVCRQYGIIRAYDLTEFYDYAKITGLVKKPSGNRLAIITSSGGSGILATDTAEENGVDVVPLDERIAARLKTQLPSQCVVSNPLDLTGDANAGRYRDSLNTVIDSDSIDIILLIFGDPIPGTCEIIQDAVKKTDKCIIAAYLGGGETEKIESAALHEMGIPVFPTPERAVKALGALLKMKN